MQTFRQWNRILLVWLLILTGVALGPARSLASCDMDGTAKAAPAHACCMKKAACDCEAASPSAAWHDGAHPAAKQTFCSCAVRPQPVNAAPKFEPLRGYMVAALPTRAGPVAPLSTVAAPMIGAEPTATFCRFVSPSPPRAPPFTV